MLVELPVSLIQINMPAAILERSKKVFAYAYIGEFLKAYLQAGLRSFSYGPNHSFLILSFCDSFLVAYLLVL